MVFVCLKSAQTFLSVSPTPCFNSRTNTRPPGCTHAPKYWHLIDFVIVRRSDLHYVKTTRATRGEDCWTDHRLIRSQLSMRVRPPARIKQPCKRKTTNALLSEEARENFQRTLNHQLKELSKPSEGPSNGPKLSAEWESITDTVLSTGKSTLGVMHKRHQDWFDAIRKEIHVILHEKNSAYKAHLQQPKPAAHYQRWIRIRSQVQHYLCEMRNSWWMTKADEIHEHANNDNTRAFYEALKSVFGAIRRFFCHVKDSTGTSLIKERDRILSRWAEHFNTLLNEKNPSNTSFLDSLPSLVGVHRIVGQLVDNMQKKRDDFEVCDDSAAKFVDQPDQLSKTDVDLVVEQSHPIRRQRRHKRIADQLPIGEVSSASVPVRKYRIEVYNRIVDTILNSIKQWVHRASSKLNADLSLLHPRNFGQVPSGAMEELHKYLLIFNDSIIAG